MKGRVSSLISFDERVINSWAKDCRDADRIVFVEKNFSKDDPEFDAVATGIAGIFFNPLSASKKRLCNILTLTWYPFYPQQSQAFDL